MDFYRGIKRYGNKCYFNKRSLQVTSFEIFELKFNLNLIFSKKKKRSGNKVLEHTLVRASNSSTRMASLRASPNEKPRSRIIRREGLLSNCTTLFRSFRSRTPRTENLANSVSRGGGRSDAPFNFNLDRNLGLKNSR